MRGPLRQSIDRFNELTPGRRYAVLAGWLLVLILALMLLTRPLLAIWQDARQWQALAQQAQTLSPPAVFSHEHWQALATSRQWVLTRVEHEAGVWQVQGELPRPEVLQQLIRTLQEQGGRALQWSLEPEAQGYRFSLQIAAGAARS